MKNANPAARQRFLVSRKTGGYHGPVCALFTLRPALVFLACVGLALAVVSQARAQPAVPATFYGSVAIEGQPVPGGTEVRAFIDGTDCTQDGDHFRTAVVVDGVSQYSIEVMHESQEPGCGVPGREVTFTVAGQPADQVAEWEPGPQRVDLTVGGGTPLPLPSGTATPGAEETSPASPTLERPTGTPPLDDVDPDDVLGGGDTQEQQQPAETSGATGVLPWVLGTAAVTLAVGVTTGWYISRRKIHGSHRS
ncbi:MAG: hypothetical protein U5Q44_13420 [Dehalococcoidia bacterium]|nr:hypothetical protein [Dehalococcoidia bacterium]